MTKQDIREYQASTAALCVAGILGAVVLVWMFLKQADFVVIVGSCFGLMAIIVGWQGSPKKEIRTTLWQWYWLVGWINTFPTDDAARRDLVPMAQLTLVRYAKIANKALANLETQRERVRQLTAARASKELRKACLMHARTSAQWQRAEHSYKIVWDLLTDSHESGLPIVSARILTDCVIYRDPGEYRRRIAYDEEKHRIRAAQFA